MEAAPSTSGDLGVSCCPNVAQELSPASGERTLAQATVRTSWKKRWVVGQLDWVAAVPVAGFTLICGQTLEGGF